MSVLWACYVLEGLALGACLRLAEHWTKDLVTAASGRLFPGVTGDMFSYWRSQITVGVLQATASCAGRTLSCRLHGRFRDWI